MPKLSSYVVDHDHGLAPHARGRYCSLVHCKFGGLWGRSNIVELAKERDWIAGTGGQGPSSAGNGRLIYFMQVDEKQPFEDYLSDPRFRNRGDCIDRGLGNAFALVS